MERARDLESGGGGFDSRLPRSLFGRVGVMFFVIFWMSWDVSGSGLGMFLDRLGKVLEKVSDGVRKSQFSKMTGSMLAESGRFRIAFLIYPRSKIPKK